MEQKKFKAEIMDKDLNKRIIDLGFVEADDKEKAIKKIKKDYKRSFDRLVTGKIYLKVELA